ncbi:MAG: sulfite oxidase-like oxidoreductase [Acidobacteriota bacterium]
MSDQSREGGDPKYQAGSPPEPEAIAADVIISPHTRLRDRVPPGQSRTRVWPVLDAFGPPEVDTTNWRLEVGGLVETPAMLDWREFMALPQSRVFSDFHCVTRWSRLGNLWEGVSTRVIATEFGVQSEAKFVILHALDHGWTTNLPLSMFLAEDSLLASMHDGQPISHEHGGPLRAVIPQLYAWKSAKWLTKVEFVAEDRAGYWEDGGYHMTGDPWREQRFRWD